MDIRNSFMEIVKEVVENEKEFTMSPRELIGYFNCVKRTKGNNGRIDSYLEDNNIETSPDYKGGYMDGSIVLRHKEKATSKTESDPIQRINILPSANKPPITITRDAKLRDATTLMLMHNFGQLPVMSNPRTVAGFISWESIGSAVSNDVNSPDVKDYLIQDVTILQYDTPLLTAIETVIDNEFVLVQKNDKTLSGIVTLADISSQFIILTKPFLLLEQIENLIRLLLDRKFLIEDLQAFAREGVTIESIDDLSFGEYILLIEKPDNWEKLKLKIDRASFIKQLNIIREIRNDIMHFDPEGITFEQKEDLKNMAKFLTDLNRFY